MHTISKYLVSSTQGQINTRTLKKPNNNQLYLHCIIRCASCLDDQTETASNTWIFNCTPLPYANIPFHFTNMKYLTKKDSVTYRHCFSPDCVSCQIASSWTAGDDEIQRTEEYPIGTHVIPCYRTRNPGGATAGPFWCLSTGNEEG